MLFPCSTLLAIQILLNKNFKKSYSIFTKKKKKNTNFPINYEILFSPSTLMSKTKVQKIPKVQMEHFQDLIIDPNITQKIFFWLGILWQ